MWNCLALFAYISTTTASDCWQRRPHLTYDPWDREIKYNKWKESAFLGQVCPGIVVRKELSRKLLQFGVPPIIPTSPVETRYMVMAQCEVRQKQSSHFQWAVTF